MTTDLRTFYTDRRKNLDAEIVAVSRGVNFTSNARLTVALAFAASVYGGFQQAEWFYLSGALVVLFALLVKRHTTQFEKLVHLKHLRAIQDEELASLEGDVSSQPDGQAFIDIHHPYSHDLDVFGRGSLFQHLNRCRTSGGMQRLAARLQERADNQEVILTWQEAARELAEMSDFRHNVQALTRQISEDANDRRQLELWLNNDPFFRNSAWYRIALVVMPAITVALVATAFFVDGLTGTALLAAAFQWTFHALHLKRVNAYHGYISGRKNTLARYGLLLQTIGATGFRTPFMQNIGATAHSGHGAVTQLATLVNALDARMNMMMNLLVNTLFLYDLQCVFRLEQWRKENRNHLFNWIDALYETEVIASMGTFSFNHPHFVFPIIQNDRVFEARNLGHPLLHEKERITNDFTMDEDRSIHIITGANMAGKSTFLRAIGVNVVLALAGAPVCASEMRCPLIDLRSGMRTADSLQDHQSYFYAELDRLKSIMDELRTGKPLLILLDEILKGTNSNDKQAGSFALVRQLVDQPCLALIATHDLALGVLEEQYPQRILNFSFEPRIDNDQLMFDYKLRRGVAQKMNATFLMKKMGILPPD